MEIMLTTRPASGRQTRHLVKAMRRNRGIGLESVGRKLILAIALLPFSASATGVSFGGGTEAIWVGLLIVVTGVLFLSLYVTNRFARKHNRAWYWAIWFGIFLWAVYSIFYKNW